MPLGDWWVEKGMAIKKRISENNLCQKHWTSDTCWFDTGKEFEVSLSIVCQNLSKIKFK